jgi:S1-C subfamily serine protease
MAISASGALKTSKQVFLTMVFLICFFLASLDSGIAGQQPVPTQSPPQAATPTPTPSSLVEERIKTLEQQVNRLEDKPKDVWDKLNAISGLISGGLVAAIGIIATYLYNERQRKNAEAQKQREIAILQVQTIQSFMPQLQSGQPKEVEAALLAIAALGNAQLATELAAIYRTEGAISALSKIASSSNRAVAEQAEKSLEALFNSLTETVVLVSTGRGQGCGFFVSQEGLVVTPGYVIGQDLENIKVVFKGTEYKARLVSPYEKEKLVLLKLENGIFPVLPIPEKVLVESGEEVFVLGREWQQEAWSFASGEIEGYTLMSSGERYIRVKVVVHPGYAGAPVINRKSEVVGVIISKGDTYASLIPVESVSEFVTQFR